MSTAGEQKNVWHYYGESSWTVVFVHGFLSNSNSCWRNASSHITWPELIDRDERLGRPNIFLADYSTRANCPEIGFKEHAEELFSYLSSDLNGLPAPIDESFIVFVCHSAGGIVTREMIDRNWESFKGKTIGLVLVASPTLGSKYASGLRLVSWLFRNQLGGQLPYRHKDLLNLHGRFKVRLESQPGDPEIFGVEFFEQFFPLGPQWFRPLPPLVHRHSSGKYFKHSRMLPGTTHSETAKPSDLRHTTHVSFLEFYERDISKRLKATTQTMPSRRGISVNARNNLGHRTNQQVVGRRDLLLYVKNLLHRGNRHYIVLLEGIGGVGKTTIAEEIAYHFIDNYTELPFEERFEAVVWISARKQELLPTGKHTTREDSSNLKDLFREVAFAMDQRDILELPIDQQASAIRNELAKHRSLIVVDNFETVEDLKLEQFISELPRPTNVIITSRRRFPSSVSVPILPFDFDDSLSLVQELSNQRNIELTDKNQENLAKLSGGIPLAVIWMLSLLSRGIELDIVAAQMSSGDNELCRFCFDEVVASVNHDQALNLLNAVSLFQNPVDKALAFEVAGLSMSDVKTHETLAELEDVKLVERSSGSLFLLPITRSYVLFRLQSAPEELERLLLKWEELIVKSASPYATVDWIWKDLRPLKTTGQHIAQCFEWALESDRVNTAIQLAPALEFFYDLTGEWTRRLEMNLVVVSLSRLAGDKKGMFIALRNLCGLYSQKGEFDKAIIAMEEGLTIAELCGETAWKCKALVSLAGANRRQGNYVVAKGFCDSARKIAEQSVSVSSRAIIASIEYEQGKIARDTEDWTEARRLFSATRDSFGGADKSNFDISRAWGVLANWAHVEAKIGDPTAARSAFLQCIDHCRNVGSKGSLSTLLLRLGELDALYSRPAEAKASLMESLELSTELGMIREISEARRLLLDLEST